MTLSERKFIFHARAVIYNGQQASMFALFYFVFLSLLLLFFLHGKVSNQWKNQVNGTKS